MTSPCTPYVTGTQASADPEACGATPEQLEPYTVQASEILYALLGRQFPGVCTATVRPTTRGNCWQAWTSYSAYGPLFGFGGGLAQYDNSYDELDPIRLTTPVVSITGVKIDGVAFSAYALRNRCELIRTDGKRWPRTTNVAPDTGVGTFSITYTFGPTTPTSVVAASTELTIELWKEAGGDPTCKLPRHTSSVSRQGLSLNLDRQVEQARSAGPSLPRVMTAMAAYNPTNQRIPPTVYSPDDEWMLQTIS